jgi:hypothetical protein
MAIVGSSLVTATSKTTQRIYNITLGPANTEQSQTLPSTIVGYMIRSRGNSELKLSHVATESGSKFVTIPGCASYEDLHTYNNLTLYFQSPQTSDTVEIVAWEV